MTGASSRRGQPLAALVLLIGGWVTMRVTLWEDITVAAPMLLQSARGGAPHAQPSRAGAGAALQPDGIGAHAPVSAGPAPHLAEQGGDVSVPAFARYPASPAPVLTPLPPRPVWLVPQDRGRTAIMQMQMHGLPPTGSMVAAGHTMLWMAALSHLPAPAALLGVQASPLPPVPPGGIEPLRRWSADGWMLWRRGSGAPLAAGLITPNYGASQAGAVLRYRLSPASGNRPTLYLRASAALDGPREREGAVGLSFRPVRRLPVSLAAEIRLVSNPTGEAVRPAVVAVSELPPFDLPLGMRGEAYGQAGYVGGRFASAFADGQVRIDRGVARLGKAELRLGAGVWGGAQKGASRLDAGPSVTLGTPVAGSAAMRLGADWRFRVAGNAAPASGPAITLSAGF